MKEHSAGIAAYFKGDDSQYRFLVCHQGGPLFKNKDWWGFPKGHVEGTERPKETAFREFLEETGIDLIDYRKLKGPLEIVTPKKNYSFYLYETAEIWNLSDLHSNDYVDKKTGETYPEIDKYAYMTLDELETKFFPRQRQILDKLKKELAL